MSESQNLFKLDTSEEDEDAFVDTEDESSDISDDLRYEENSWPKDNPTGYSLKGKKRLFIKVVENIKLLMKKGSEKVIGNVTFKVLDSLKVPHGVEHEVQICKDKEKGIAILKIFGPSTKKGCTLMTNKAKKQETKFVDILTFDIVKLLIDRYGHGDGWIELLKVKPRVAKKDDSKSHYCHFCNNGFCNIKNLRVHIEKYHQVSVNHRCERCDFTALTEEEFKKHMEKNHIDKIIFECKVCVITFTNEKDFKKHTEEHKDTRQEKENKKHLEKGHKDMSFMSSDDDVKKHEDESHEDESLCTVEEMDIENTDEIKEGNKRERNLSPPNSNPSSPPTKKFETDESQKDLEDQVENLILDEGSVSALKAKICQLEKTLDEIKHSHMIMETELYDKNEEIKNLKKNISDERKEFKLLEKENEKLNLELENIQKIKETSESEAKAIEKLNKIKENTRLFNKIIKDKVKSGEFTDIDISKYVDDDMEECDGGDVSIETTGYGSLNRIAINKKLGGRRSNPKEEPFVLNQKPDRRQTKMHRCPQCDFVTQNETHFNEHITTVHANQPTCPFCFMAFKGYAEVRKHCETNHSERNNLVTKTKNIKTKPCRYFRNGEGRCIPPSGVCKFDHSVIPDSERELCLHKQACKYKPYCIFLHPEGQVVDEWQPVRKNPARICIFTANGGICSRPVCHFFHPVVQDQLKFMNNSDFHQESLKKPPLRSQEEIITIENIPLLPKRVPVIVWNKQKQTDVIIKSLSRSLKETRIN